MVDKISQAVLFLLIVIDGSVDEFFEIFEPSEALVGVLDSKRIGIAGVLDCRNDDVCDWTFSSNTGLINLLDQILDHLAKGSKSLFRTGRKIDRLINSRIGDGRGRHPER